MASLSNINCPKKHGFKPLLLSNEWKEMSNEIPCPICKKMFCSPNALNGHIGTVHERIDHQILRGEEFYSFT